MNRLPFLVAATVAFIQADAFGQYVAADTYNHPMDVRADFRPGNVYLLGGQRPQVVVELLAKLNLKADNAWVSTRPLDPKYNLTLAAQSWWVYGSRGWVLSPTSIVFASDGYTIAVEGEQELPAIVNRPLSGQRSQRDADQQVVQMRRQLSRALETSRSEGREVAACVAVRVLKDPTIRFSGYAVTHPEATARYAASLVESTGLKLDSFAEDEKTGAFVVRFKGEVLVESRFRYLREGDATSFADSGFYLGKEFTFRYFLSR